MARSPPDCELLAVVVSLSSTSNRRDREPPVRPIGSGLNQAEAQAEGERPHHHNGWRNCAGSDHAQPLGRRSAGSRGRSPATRHGTVRPAPRPPWTGILVGQRGWIGGKSVVLGPVSGPASHPNPSDFCSRSFHIWFAQVRTAEQLVAAGGQSIVLQRRRASCRVDPSPAGAAGPWLATREAPRSWPSPVRWWPDVAGRLPGIITIVNRVQKRFKLPGLGRLWGVGACIKVGVPGRQRPAHRVGPSPQRCRQLAVEAQRSRRRQEG